MRIVLRASMFVLSAIPFLAACESAGYQKVDATSERMHALRENAGTLKTSVGNAADSLATVVEKADIDPKPSFDRFTKDVGAVESAFKQAESRFSEAKTQSYKLFGEWSTRTATMTDPDLKKLSEERRTDLSEKLDKVVAAMQPAMDETRAFVATTNDLVQYLSLDLTPRGIKAISEKAKTQVRAANSIGDKLDKLMAAADEAALEFATAKPPPPPKK